MRTRTEMEQIIQSGGSVVYHGRILSSLHDLPSDAELAAGNPERETIAVTTLQQQIADLQAQLAQLQLSQAPQGAPPTAELAPELVERLAVAGYDTPEAIAAASDEELLAIEGIGPATLKRIRGKA